MEISFKKLNLILFKFTMSIVKPKTNTLNHLIYIKFPSSLMTSRDLPKWIGSLLLKTVPVVFFVF